MPRCCGRVEVVQPTPAPLTGAGVPPPETSDGPLVDAARPVDAGTLEVAAGARGQAPARLQRRSGASCACTGRRAAARSTSTPQRTRATVAPETSAVPTV